MLQTTKENFIYKTFIVISLFICPVVVIAPLGSWVPLALAAISCFLFNKNIHKKKLVHNSKLHKDLDNKYAF